MKLLLHACCGPCSLEPVRLLQQAGHDITIFYANSNIAPFEEYRHRLETLHAWAHEEGIPVIEGVYNADDWEECAGKPFDKGSLSREDRCRACYRLRLEEASRYAAANGFEGLGTTLSVSPYQYSQIICEEVQRAAAQAGVEAVFEDYRTCYGNAVLRSKKLGMYRQNYCGCRISLREAQLEREERKMQRAAQKAAWREEHAEELAAQAEERDRKKDERKAYAEKQARKRAILKQLRQSDHDASPDETNASH